jgi:hypothetical protein
MGFTNARKLAQLDQDLGSSSPATLYIGALLTIPAEDGTGYTEPSGGSYARKSVTNNATNFPAAAMNSNTAEKKLAVTQAFVSATASWGTVKGYGLFDSATIGAGTLYAFAEAIQSPKIITAVDSGTDTLTAATHGLAAGMEVQFKAQNGALPAGLSANTVYYVIAAGLTASDFRVSTTLGGSAVNITDSGSGTLRVFQSFWKAIGNGDTLSITANQLVFQHTTAF